MRTRKQINKDLENLEKNLFEDTKVELLLDIRELLDEIKCLI